MNVEGKSIPFSFVLMFLVIGPEAGDAGGNLVYADVPDGVKKVKESYKGKYL